MRATDLALEAQIDFAALRLATVPTIEARRKAWDDLRELVQRRTPERVEEMERQRGLMA